MWDLVLSEVVRQCHVQCAERGILLERLRVRYAYLVRAQAGYLQSYQNMTARVLDQCETLVEAREETELQIEMGRGPALQDHRKQIQASKTKYVAAQQEANKKVHQMEKMSTQKKTNVIQEMNNEEKGLQTRFLLDPDHLSHNGAVANLQVRCWRRCRSRTALLWWRR